MERTELVTECRLLVFVGLLGRKRKEMRYGKGMEGVGKMEGVGVRDRNA